MYLSHSLYLPSPPRIDELRFQAECRKRRLNLALVFLCLFCVVVHFFRSASVCSCCVRYILFLSMPRQATSAWGSVSELTHFVWSGTENHHSINQLDVPTCRRSTVGGRAFPVAGAAKVWNGLPSEVTSASSLSVFKNRLKTRDLRSFEIRFEFESAVPIRLDSTVMGRFENFRITV